MHAPLQINPDPAVFVDDKFTPYGKWMDGWESRRKRVPGNDWCIIQLAFPGRIRGILVDTAHFTGNQVPRFALSGASLDLKDPRVEALARVRTPCYNGGQCQLNDPRAMAAVGALDSQDWKQIVRVQALNPGYEETRR